jgi:hypothetical protein
MHKHRGAKSQLENICFGLRKIIPILVYIIYRNACACNVYINTDNWVWINIQIIFWDHAIFASPKRAFS